MHVLLLTQHFWPENNAPAFRWHWLSNGLREQGLSLEVITAGWRSEELPDSWPEKVTVHRVANIVSGLGISRRILNEILVGCKFFYLGMRAAKPDAIVVSAPPVVSFALGFLLSLLRRRPLILDLRDAWPELLDSWQSWSDYGDGEAPPGWRSYIYPVLIRCFHYAMRLIRNYASLVVTTSEDFAQYLRQSGHHNAICVRNTAHPCPPLAPPHNNGCFKVLYMGNIGRAQYLATAIRAAKIVEQHGEQIQLRIVGSGAHRNALSALAQRIEAPVMFLPRVAQSETRRHYEWCDSILIMLRDWPALSMTVPSKLYDALATGRHITASVSGESAAIVGQSYAGDVVPPQDPQALAELWIRLAQSRPTSPSSDSSQWLDKHADQAALSEEFACAIRQVVQAWPKQRKTFLRGKLHHE